MRCRLAALLVVAVCLPVQPALAESELSPPLGPVQVIAHRGASYDAPEHTFAAYDRAVRAGADFLECDLQLTKDEVLVCVHDTTVDRTSDGTGRVDSFTLAELRTLDFGSWFNTANPLRPDPAYAGLAIVPFEEQLRCYSAVDPGLRFHLETKAPAEYGGRMEPALLAVLARNGYADGGTVQSSRVLVQSFELASLERMKGLAPTLPTVFLSAAPPPDQLDGSTPAYVDAVSPSAPFLLANPAYTGLAHARGHEVQTYTVDDPDQMDALLQIGVDGIFTNRADLLRERVDARGTGTPAAQRHARELADGCPGVAGSVTAADTAPAPVVPEARWPVLLAGAGVVAVGVRRRGDTVTG